MGVCHPALIKGKGVSSVRAYCNVWRDHCLSVMMLRLSGVGVSVALICPYRCRNERACLCSGDVAYIAQEISTGFAVRTSASYQVSDSG